MNWKLLGTMTALIGVGTSIALAQGTAPTVVQADYISNVFGQSNFVKNPNAKLNVKDVTTVTATVTRSTTTPLVATSEFTVAIGTANGTATWSTRTFDQGMKNNNCEARFSYRGFAATSKVHIKQGANTVASLNLTPATDPRIASINFPCGDLSVATTFVVTDTATLAGTNEIGGIYVGLATNMANVAQAEAVFRARGTNGAAIPSSFSATNVVFPTTTFDNDGGYNAATGIYTIKRAGRYLVHARVAFVYTNPFPAVADNYLHVNKNSSTVASAFWSTPLYDAYPNPQIMTYADFVVGDTVNIAVVQTTGTARNLFTVVEWSEFTLSRFPTASELVVTPERQNTWAGVIYTNENQNLFSGVAEPTASTPYTNATWNQPTKLKGKASVTTTNSGNDLGFSVANLPVGNYKFDVTGLFNSNQSVNPGNTLCNFRLKETNTGAEIAAQMHQDFATTIETRNFVNAFTGVFNNTSVATRNFRIEAQKVIDSTSGNVAACQAYSSTSASSLNTNLAIIMTPLDQPSNSALYVQGPVKAAETGAAIPAGYVGEVKRLSSGSGATLVPASNTWFTVGAGLTLPAGVWSCSASMAYNRNAATFSSPVGQMIQAFSESSTTSPAYNWQFQGIGRSLDAVVSTFSALNVGIRPIVFYSNGSQLTWPDGVQRGTNILYTNGYLGTFSGTPQYYSETECVRLN